VAFIMPTDPPTPQKDPQLNLSRTQNTKILEAVNASRATDDKQKQLEQYRIIQQEMATDKGFIWLVQLKGAVVTKNDINGMKGWTLPSGEPSLGSPPPFLFTAYMWRSA
jgi:ABC-type transport system substrate-binding protein